MKQPIMLTMKVPQGNTLSCRDWINRSVRYRNAAPSATSSTVTGPTSAVGFRDVARKCGEPAEHADPMEWPD